LIGWLQHGLSAQRLCDSLRKTNITTMRAGKAAGGRVGLRRRTCRLANHSLVAMAANQTLRLLQQNTLCV